MLLPRLRLKPFDTLSNLNYLVLIAFASTLAMVSGCTNTPVSDYDPSLDSLRFAGEVHLRNIRQLTFGGNNAEAYWSFDDSMIVFQSDWSSINSQGCDQIYTMAATGM